VEDSQADSGAAVETEPDVLVVGMGPDTVVGTGLGTVVGMGLDTVIGMILAAVVESNLGAVLGSDPELMAVAALGVAGLLQPCIGSHLRGPMVTVDNANPWLVD
jgi:hypothetical protein